ncbi:MAG: PaaI family thioesterase [Streptosporangiaceae bacterium]
MNGLTPPEGATLPERHPSFVTGEKIGPHFTRCFGCGPDHGTGLHISPVIGEGLELTAEFTVGEEHQGAPGLAHGGVLAAALDESLGMVATMLHKPYVTGRLEVDYRQPVPQSTTVHLRAWCEGASGRKLFLAAEARLGGPDGPVALRSKALFVEVGVEHFRDRTTDHEVNP